MVTSNIPLKKKLSALKGNNRQPATADPPAGKIIFIVAGLLLPPASAFNTGYLKAKNNDPL